MHIKDIETFVVGVPDEAPGGRYFIFVKLTSDGGVTGWGEAYGASFGPAVMAAAIEDVAARHLVGRDPHAVEAFFRRCYSSGFTQRPDLSMMGCYSALEIACWDIVGKEAGKPVHALIGGRVHEALRSYTYLYPADGRDLSRRDERRAECLQRSRSWRRRMRCDGSSRASRL
jgi:galactonate dehydratase